MAANPNQRTGKAFIYLDGTLYESMKDSTLDDVLGVEATPVVAATGTVGYADEPKTTILNCKLIVGQGVTSANVAAMVNSEGQFQCDTGENYLCSGLFRISAQLDPANHALNCKFGMTSCTPIAA